MYNCLKVIKFNENYYEDGDIVAVTREDGFSYDRFNI